mmetsp:Transcript_43403/g.86233  ORF Transcript_43403/g.86233 Transcript_43403/m.86233 type:complete len:212 (+) Transcript_43403:127-762(+)
MVAASASGVGPPPLAPFGDRVAALAVARRQRRGLALTEAEATLLEPDFKRLRTEEQPQPHRRLSSPSPPWVGRAPVWRRVVAADVVCAWGLPVAGGDEACGGGPCPPCDAPIGDAMLVDSVAPATWATPGGGALPSHQAPRTDQVIANGASAPAPCPGAHAGVGAPPRGSEAWRQEVQRRAMDEIRRYRQALRACENGLSVAACPGAAWYG